MVGLYGCISSSLFTSLGHSTIVKRIITIGERIVNNRGAKSNNRGANYRVRLQHVPYIVHVPPKNLFVPYLTIFLGKTQANATV